MLVYGWLSTLCDGPSWQRERPSLAMGALDLVMWVYAQVNCCRCIFMLYCVHNHCNVTVPIHVTKWHWFPRVCDMHQYAWCFEELWLILAQACCHVPYTRAWNPASVPQHTKHETLPDFHCENEASPLPYFSWQNLGEDSVLCTMTHLRSSPAGFSPWKQGKMLLDFRYGNFASILNTPRKHRSRPHPFQN